MATIIGTDAGESLQGTGGEDVIYGLGGNDILDGGGGGDTLYGGEGNDRIRQVSSGAQVQHHQMFGEGGDDELILDLRSSQADTALLDGGTGNDRIAFDAWRPLQALTIAGGDGDDFIHIVGGKTIAVDGGAGADRIELEYNNSATSYAFTFGQDSDILDLTRLWTLTQLGAPIHITDFEVGAAGDRIILDRLLMTLAGWDRVTNPFASGHLVLVQRGGDAVLQIDLNDGGLRDFLVLEGVDATTLTGRNLGLAPDGGSAPAIVADGSAGADFLDGAGGDDLLRGLEGADHLFGGLGNDQLEGGLGADTLEGGFGNDMLLGGEDDDRLIDFDAGDDQLLGGEGNDTLEVMRSYREPAGTIVLDGGLGNDTMTFSVSPYYQRRGRIDHVTFLGGDGDDRIRAEGAGVVEVDAGTGADHVHVAIDGTANFVTLGSGADTLELGAEANRAIWAVTIRDFEAGNSGDRLDIEDYLEYALTGWDPLTNPFEAGYLQLVQRGADAVLQIDVDGQGGIALMTDLVIFQNLAASSLTTLNLGGFATLTGTEGDDLIEGDSGNNTLLGLGGNDTLNGNDGDDFLDGGAGDDVMSGGTGEDIYIVSDAGDQVIEAYEFVAFGGDEVRTSLPVYAMPTNVERLVGTSDTGQMLTSYGGAIIGGGGNDVIQFGDGGGSADGGNGDDRIDGGAGNDSLYGGAGSDILHGYDGDDFLAAGSWSVPKSGNDYLDGGAGNDTLRGSRGDDTLIGGIGDDDLYDDESGGDLFGGGEGNDHLTLTRSSGVPVTGGAVRLLGGTGDDTIALIVRNATTVRIDAGDGDDSLDLYGFSGIGRATLGAGADTIYFSDYLPQADPNGRLTITDFDTGAGGDTLSWDGFLRGWLTGWDPAANPFDTGHIRLARSGTSTLLQLDRDGGGDGFFTVLTFENTDPTDFTAAHLGYAPSHAAPMLGDSDNNIMTGSAADDVLRGETGQDWLIGGGGGDRIGGGDGHDTLWGDAGDDLLDGGDGDDVIAGGAGVDTASYADALAGVEINLSYPEEQRTRGAGVDTLISIENVIGSSFDDILAGNMDANVLSGGGGADRFVFDGLGARDTIADFESGDRIDLSAIDANGALAGDGAFAFVGDAAFGGVAGELRVSGSGFDWTLEADINGDGVADFSIAVITQATGNWSASDFLL